jgi:hypothetical protein
MSYNADAQVFETQIVVTNTTQPAGVTSGSIINRGSLSTYDTYVTGHTVINNVKITPNLNDIIYEQQATLNNSQNSWADITDFYFDDSVKLNSHILLNENITNYISLHLRLGDKYLETDNKFIDCKDDTRKYNEQKLFEYIENNIDKTILFFCDNNSYKLKIKNKYNNVIITNSSIGHTSLKNTTDKQILDAVTEFYIISNSNLICAVSESGFSIIASKMKNIPLINIK